MSFHNERLDTSISLGAVGGPTFGTTIQTTASGHEYRVARQSRARRRYQFAKTLMEPSEWASLAAFWAARRGHLHGFRFKDWSDYTTSSDGVSAPTNLDVILGTGDGATTQFQLLKTYDKDGLNPYTEALTLPVAGTVVVSVAGSGTSSWTMTNPGGVITFATAPTAGQIVRAGCEFDRAVRFDTPTEWFANRFSAAFVGNWETIDCVELLDETETPELVYHGGSEQVATAQDVLLTYHAAFWNIQVSTSAINVWLPSPDRVPGGPAVFVVYNNGSSSGTIQLKDDAGNNVGSTFSAGAARRVALSRNSGTATWIAYA